MAEQVQAALDQMVEPLRDLMDRHIFTESEIRLIVNRRRESEYLLRRRAARKADFIRYIDAEMTLERLRSLRTFKKKRDHRKNQRQKDAITSDDDDDDDDDDGGGNDDNENENKKEHIGDVHIVQHIHLLFVRLIRKFRGDISLHLRHAEFCKTVKSLTRLGRVYAEALQIFPRESGLWIEAASHEFFGPNRSVKAARVLLQRALRLNERIEELWLQYFTLELHYAQTLKGRSRILHPEKEHATSSLPDDDDNDNEVSGGDDYYKISLVILRNAIKAIPRSVQFRLKFLDVCKNFPETSGLMDFVQNSMSQDFAAEPESWIARAVYESEKIKNQIIDNDENQQPPKSKKNRPNNEAKAEGNQEVELNNKNLVMEVLGEAIETIPTSQMIIQAFRFAEDYRNQLLSSDNNDTDAVKAIDDFIHKLWVKADGIDSSEIALEKTYFLLNSNRTEQALKTIKAYCAKSRKVGVATAPSEAWILWTSLVTPLKKQKGVLERAVRTIPMNVHPDYVSVLLQLFGAQMKTMEEDDYVNNELDESSLLETLQKVILLAPKTVGDVQIEGTGLNFELKDIFSAYLSCLNLFQQRSGIQGSRSVYESVLFRSSVNLSDDNEESLKLFIERCLELEQEELDKPTTSGNRIDTGNERTKRRHLRKLYNKAVEIFGDLYREDRNEKCIFVGGNTH